MEGSVKDTPKPNLGQTYRQWIYALLANCTLLVYGLDSGWISPITSLLQSEASPAGYKLSDSQISWTASVLSMAAIFGTIIYSYIADRYGRKIAVIIIAFLEAVSWIIRLSYTSPAFLIIARVVAGLAAGGCFNIVPMYVKEISQQDLSGILGTFPILMNTTGIFMIYLIGAYLEYKTVIIIVTAVPIFTMIAMISAPESPAFLVKQEKIEKAKETVASLRGLDKDDEVVLKLVGDMIKEEIRFKSLPKVTFMNICKLRLYVQKTASTFTVKNSSWRHGFILIIFVFTFYEINGAFVIVTFSSKILNSTGVQFDISPEIQSLSIPIVMVIATLGLTTIVERWGRRPLLMVAYGITAIAMYSLAIMIVIQKQYGNVPSWLPLIALVISVAMCSGGVSPLSIIIMTEMFNFQIRAKVMGVVVTYAWFTIFIAQSTYTPIANTLGEFAPFILYGTVNLLSVIFIIFFLLETKGKTEEEIFKNVKKRGGR